VTTVLLLQTGTEPRLARFAATHASWQAPGIELEDLLVSLADKIWKAKRVPDLEQLVVDRLAVASSQQPCRCSWISTTSSTSWPQARITA
jgi:hypothetical protein